MLVHQIVLTAILLAFTLAQTPSNFSPSAQVPLDVSFPNNLKVSPPGVLLPETGVSTSPTVSLTNISTTNTTYSLFLLDLNIPSTTTPTNKTTYLHLFSPSLISSPNGTLTTSPSHPTTLIGAPYYPPSPPAGDGPHSYVVLLFTQPANFSVPSAYADINPPTGTGIQLSRLGFNVTAFADASSLGAPVAGTWFRAENSTSTATATASASASATAALYQGGGVSLPAKFSRIWRGTLVVLAIPAAAMLM